MRTVALDKTGTLTRHSNGTRPDELLERTAIKVPADDEYETVAGYVTDVLDRIPEVGDEVHLDAGVLRVERVEGHRVERLRWTPARTTSAVIGPGSGHHLVSATGRSPAG